MNAPNLHAVPFSIRRRACRAYRSRQQQIKMIAALLYLRERKLQPRVPNYAFYAQQHSSYRQATGHDLKTMDERKWERLAEKAYRLVLA